MSDAVKTHQDRSLTMNAISRISLPYASDEQRWAAVRARDAAADGVFLYSVATTGVYCHPSCAARPARRENVAFHASRAQAERQGYRACKRCKPDLPPKGEREAALVAQACRSIEAAEGALSLEELAAEAGVSPFHFHRLFRRIVGVTPKAYAAAKRSARVQHGLAQAGSVTETIYEAGFNSAGRFYEAASGMLGMTPSAWRAGGAGETIGYGTGESSLGTVLVATTARGICAILIGDPPEELAADLAGRFPKARIAPDVVFQELVERVIAYVDAPGNGIGLPLDIRGTAFQRQVWEVLQSIPAGETRSYTEVAAMIGNPKAVRAVATACASNRLAVAVPCHRVVAGDGGLAGYRWGIDRKRALLERERG
jgi:AraC family transcriptional regulator of adaptative response/methylated-DNA-[protein]-cysteine methyltransferase